MPMGYFLHRSQIQAVAGPQTSWSARLTVTSSDVVLYPPKVFVFQAEDPANPATRGWFTAVASPAQLEEYPEDAPAEVVSGESQQPYYRVDSLQLVTRSADDINNLVADIRLELAQLTRNLDAIRNLQEPETIPIIP